MAQVTLDGYIARPDGKRDWYLNPDKYGVTKFFSGSAAKLYTEDGKIFAEYADKRLLSGNSLSEVMEQLGEIDGYLSVEVFPTSMCQLVEELFRLQLVTEVHRLLIPVRLDGGFRCPAFNKAIEGLHPVSDERLRDGISYSVYRLAPGSAEDAL